MSAATSQMPTYQSRAQVPEGLHTLNQLRQMSPRRVLVAGAKARGRLLHGTRELELYAVDDTIPRYTAWGQVPDGLHSRTQLARMDPPRKPAEGARPRAQIVYHGNEIAPLYALDDTTAKRTASPAQRAALARASALRHVCARCAATTYPGAPDAPPPRWAEPWQGRRCDRCRQVEIAHTRHADAQAEARDVVAELAARTAVVVASDHPTRPRRLALVAYPAAGPGGAGDGRVLLDAQLPEPGTGADAYARTLTRAEGLLAGLDRPALLICWKQCGHPLGALARGSGRPAPAWMDVWSPDLLPVREVAWYWTPWHHEPHPATRGERWGPGDGFAFHPHYRPAPPGAGGDPAADAALIMRTLVQVADGTAPVHPHAPWLAYPPAPGHDGP